MPATMAKSKKPDQQPAATPPEAPAEDESKGRGPVLYMRLNAELEAAMSDFIRSQVVRPSRTAVVEAALRLFFQKHGQK